MQATECLVLLIYGPRLTVELDFDHVLGVSSMIQLVLDHLCLQNLHVQWNLEEDCAMSCAIFRALLDMVHESLSREENVAELALHGD